MKFKVDDRVRIVDADQAGGKYMNGDTGTLSYYLTENFCWYTEINSTVAKIFESEMELIEMNLLKDLTATIEVAPGHPETTKAIVRLLIALGCTDYCYAGIMTNEYITEEASWLYIRDGMIDGWDRAENQHRLHNEVLSTIKPKPKAKIVTPDGTEIELSDETWESMRESLK